MEIVIDISDTDYSILMSDKSHCPRSLTNLEWKIVNGTPLPKGHGRLIDADALNISHGVFLPKVKGNAVGCPIDAVFADEIDDAPTVIEADTETWNSCHGQVTVPKGTMERIYNEADNMHDKEMI